jgi:DNA-binding response OmpR family regulator
MHQVGATFLAPIDPRQYVAASAYRDPAGAQGTSAGQIVPAKILFVNDETLDRELMSMTVRNSPMKVDSVEGPTQALAAINKELFDVVIIDLNHGEQSVDLIRSVRAIGFRGPVLLLTVDTTSTAAKASADAGADDVVRKPYDAAMLVLRVSNQIRARNMPTGDSPIYSEIEDVLSVSGPVANYIEAARQKLADIERALAEGNVELATSVCEVLMATGTGFGFPIVADCAALALWTVNEGHSVVGARDELRRLAQVIERLTVRERQDENKEGVKAPTPTTADPKDGANAAAA